MRLAAGAGLLYLTHLGFLVIKVQLAALGPSASAGAGLWQLADDFFEISGKVFFPVLIWLVLALPYMLGATDRRRKEKVKQHVPGRNDPCPCGSGRKYKFCCGIRR